MDHPDPQSTDIDARLAELTRTYEDLRSRCLCRSAIRTAQETARLAKSHQRLITYMYARFNIMNQAQGQFEPELGREVAIELIALLENQDRARLLQPDFPEEEYFNTVGWMSSCAYDNLAKHTAKMQGYNSEGMHACINDGIQVCRRTGKLRCITCFREYATDVYLAADDLDMALHYCRLVQSMPKDAPNSERRWVGAWNETWLQILLADLDAAEAMGKKSLELAESYHTPVEARIDSQVRQEVIMLLAGKSDPRDDAAFLTRQLPAQEFITLDLEWDKRDAVRACCLGDFDKSNQLLEHWDRWLLQRKCLDEWFEVRLRLLALKRLSGQTDKMDGLAQPLVEKARKANDWLTLHRLGRLFDPAETASPLALLGPLKTGPFSASAPSSEKTRSAGFSPPPAEQPPHPSPSPGEGEEAASATPLEDMIQQFAQRLNQAGENRQEIDRLRQDVLALDAGSVEHPFDAVRLLHLLLYVTTPGPGSLPIWDWAKAVAGKFMQVPDVLNLLASLGQLLRDFIQAALSEVLRQAGAPPVAIETEEIEGLFRKSLDLDPFNPHNHARAGGFFLSENNLGEAERCLARGFRLMRNNSFLAERLAEVYDRTDRPRDALAVLDLCLREGSEDPNITWRAVLKAYQLEQFASLLTYLDRFESHVPNQPWANYYRAIGLLETGKPAEALLALDKEEKVTPDYTFSRAVLRGVAFSQQGQAEQRAEARTTHEAEARSQFQQALAIPLVGIDYLSTAGLANLLQRLWRVAAAWPVADPLRRQLVSRLLAVGLAPDTMFDLERQQGEDVEGVHHFRCTIRQPLDDNWSRHEGCLHHQMDWRDFRTMWGVLAMDEDDATRQVLAWQARSFAAPAEILDCELLGGPFTDKPGIVWQSERWTEEAEEKTSEPEA